jgi:hypothetical protein
MDFTGNAVFGISMPCCPQRLLAEMRIDCFGFSYHLEVYRHCGSSVVGDVPGRINPAGVASQLA